VLPQLERASEASGKEAFTVLPQLERASEASAKEAFTVLLQLERASEASGKEAFTVLPQLERASEAGAKEALTVLPQLERASEAGAKEALPVLSPTLRQLRLLTLPRPRRYGNVKFRDLDAEMRRAIGPLCAATDRLLYRIDADTDAFGDYMTAIRMPKGTEEEKKVREEAMQDGLKVAIDVPLETMKIADTCWDWMVELATVGNINCKSDLQVRREQNGGLEFLFFRPANNNCSCRSGPGASRSASGAAGRTSRST
jgi:hypothetical protein